MTPAWIGPRALADASGVSTDTLRHYERIGLLTGTTRTTAGYRRYPPTAIERVRLIQRALVVGFSLKELASALGQRDRGVPPCQRVRALVGERLEALEQRLDELSTIRDEMRVLLREWDERLAETPAGQRARLLDVLASHPVLDVGGQATPTPPVKRARRLAMLSPPNLGKPGNG
ncbi:MAG: MerR family transcriptional regulator [Acidobacteriota bacterium]